MPCARPPRCCYRGHWLLSEWPLVAVTVGTGTDILVPQAQSHCRVSSQPCMACQWLKCAHHNIPTAASPAGADEVYGPGTETLVMEEDAQPLEVPIIAPVKTRRLESTESAPPPTSYTNEFMATLMANAELVRAPRGDALTRAVAVDSLPWALLERALRGRDGVACLALTDEPQLRMHTCVHTLYMRFVTAETRLASAGNMC